MYGPTPTMIDSISEKAEMQAYHNSNYMVLQANTRDRKSVNTGM